MHVIFDRCDAATAAVACSIEVQLVREQTATKMKINNKPDDCHDSIKRFSNVEHIYIL